MCRGIIVFPLNSAHAKLMTQGESLGRPVIYTGTMDCFRKTVFGCEKFNIKPGGVASLYTGCGPLLLKMVPAIGLEMAAIEAGMQFFRKYTG